MSKAIPASMVLTLAPLVVCLATALGTPEDEPHDLTPAFETFAKEISDGTRGKNELRISAAAEEFRRELAKYQGKEVRCTFKARVIKTDRVYLANPLYRGSPGNSHHFVFITKDNSLPDETARLLTDQVFLEGAPNLHPAQKMLATISVKAASRLNEGDPVELRGTLQPLKATGPDSGMIQFKDARVVEP